MNLTNTLTSSAPDTQRVKNQNPELSPIPPIIRAHFPPDHLISKDEIQKCHNKLQYDRSLLDTEKHRIQGHLEHVEQYGLMMDREVPEGEAPAWEWARPYLRKEEGE